MKQIIKGADIEPICNVLLYTEKSHPISINEDDVDNLLDDATFIAFLVANGDNLKDALKKLDPKELDYDKTTKAIFVVRYSQTYQMTASEMSELGGYVNRNLSKADVRWGFATKSESDRNVTVIVATTH